MQEMIGQLIENGSCVRWKRMVWCTYSVESFPDYGKLSGNTLDHLQSGAGGRTSMTMRISQTRNTRLTSCCGKPTSSSYHEVGFTVGNGLSRAGTSNVRAWLAIVWRKDVIDIHTGGEDLIFPHHECEIAQSRGATGADRVRDASGCTLAF